MIFPYALRQTSLVGPVWVAETGFGVALKRVASAAWRTCQAKSSSGARYGDLEAALGVEVVNSPSPTAASSTRLRWGPSASRF